MTEQPIQKAGSALIWQAVKMGGVKLIFLARIFILARLLLPDDFGLVAIATTAMGFLFNLTNLGITPALVQGNETTEAHYDAAWTLDFYRSLILTIVVIFAAPFIAVVFAESRAIPVIQVLAFRPLLESLTSIKVVALNRNLSFRPLAILRIVEAIVNTLLAILLAKSIGAWALVAGSLGGALSIVVVSYILAPYRPKLSLDWRSIRPLIHFGKWMSLTNILSLTANYILRVVITRQFGTAGLGVYSMASQLAFMPGDVAGEAVGAVAFPLFARLQNDVRQATRVFQAMFSGLAAILYPVCALLVVLSPSLVSEVLGTNWVGTDSLIGILAIVVMFGIFGEVTVSVFKGFGQPYRIAILEVIQSSITITLIWILPQYFGLIGAALAWLPAIIVSQLMSARFLVRVLEQPFNNLYKPFLAILVSTAGCMSVAVIANQMIPGIVGLGLSIVLGGLFTVASLWIADRRFQLGFAHNLVSVFPQISQLTPMSRFVTVEKK
jgi:lipopolysaccharide exporter